ncbi:MAG: hypothetical protein LBF91_00085 [Azoarcus sp.]|jgi:Cu+-exporting ATPase|nr:hypothetical protein [Azoarcus sp.]
MGVGAEAADIVLMRDSLYGVADAIGLSLAALTKIRQSLFLVFAYLSLLQNASPRRT